MLLLMPTRPLYEENGQKRVVEWTGPDRVTNRHLLLFETKKFETTYVGLKQNIRPFSHS